MSIRAATVKLLRWLLEKLDPQPPAPFKPEWWEVPLNMTVGARVVVNEKSGFSRGSTGAITHIDYNGRIWVERDGSGSSLYFYPHELDLCHLRPASK